MHDIRADRRAPPARGPASAASAAVMPTLGPTLRPTLTPTLAPTPMLALTLALALAVGVAAEPVPQLLDATTREPRAFGYQVGDVVERSVRVHVPTGLVLDDASVPKAAARGKAIELKSVSMKRSAEPGGQRLELGLAYQLFVSPVEARTLELPVITLRFKGEPRAQELRIEAWPVSVSPLAPAEASPRRGLGELQPDAPAPLLDTEPARRRLVAFAVAALGLGLLLLHIYVGIPWVSRRQRPFAQAWRELRRLEPTSAAPVARAAARTLHRAFDRSAGEVVFAGGIDRFIAAKPNFAPLRDDLARFFEHSRRMFFASADAAAMPARADDVDPAWLAQFARRCRDAERGTA